MLKEILQKGIKFREDYRRSKKRLEREMEKGTLIGRLYEETKRQGEACSYL